jgi:regulator of ribonuclease activity A
MHLNKLKPFSTADICDILGQSARPFTKKFYHFGASRAATGPLLLLSIENDNQLLFDILENSGLNRILLIHVADESRPAVVGANSAKKAKDNGWAGIIVDGAVRDLPELRELDLPILARFVSPFRIRKTKGGTLPSSMNFGGVDVFNSDIICLDEDGIVVIDKNLFPVT